jgi:hypothetical protein
MQLGRVVVGIVIALGVVAVDLRPCGAAPAAEAERIRLSVTAPAGCATSEGFVAALHARAAATVVEAGEVRAFAVAIEVDGEAFTGSLTVREVGGATTRREVHGDSCAETAAALALIAALAVEERAAAVEERTAADEARTAAAAARAAAARAVVAVAPATAAVAPWQLWVGGGAARDHGPTPADVFAVPLFVAIGHAGRELRLTASRSARDDVAMSAGAARFRLTAARLDGCPWSWAVGPLAVAPCLGVEAGVLDGRGAQVAMPAGGARPWLAPDGAMRMRLAWGRVAIELEGAVAVPVWRDRFYIAPATTVHQVPAVTVGVGLGLAIEVW